MFPRPLVSAGPALRCNHEPRVLPSSRLRDYENSRIHLVLSGDSSFGPMLQTRRQGFLCSAKLYFIANASGCVTYYSSYYNFTGLPGRELPRSAEGTILSNIDNIMALRPTGTNLNSSASMCIDFS